MLIVGMFVISLSKLLAHYIEVSDVLKGISTGIGFGLIALALISFKLSIYKPKL